MTPDEVRTARLLFAPELAAGAVDERALLASPAVAAAVRARPIPLAPTRVLQRVAMKRGSLTYDDAVVGPLQAARRSVLGERADGPPRFLVRMDEYPNWLAAHDPGRYGDAAFAPWQEIMAGCPHLIAVVPRIAADPLDPRGTTDRALTGEEVGRLQSLQADGVDFAMHGLNHRTRHRDPRRQSELAGRDRAGLDALLDRAEAELARFGIRPRVLVPPFNRFDARQYAWLAQRYDVITGGPESVARIGFHSTPQWRGEAVYLPAYAPLYGTAAEVLPAVERYLDLRIGGYVPIVLHWAWEAERSWEDLRRLAATVAPHATPWSEFLTAVEASR